MWEIKVTEISKLSADSALSFGAIEENQKHKIGINSEKGRFRTKKSDFFYNKNLLWNQLTL